MTILLFILFILSFIMLVISLYQYGYSCGDEQCIRKFERNIERCGYKLYIVKVKFEETSKNDDEEEEDDDVQHPDL